MTAYRPSLAAVEAAIAAWNRAEPDRPLVGSSWVTTFAEVLVAGREAERAEAPPRLDVAAYPPDGSRCRRCGSTFRYGQRDTCLADYPHDYDPPASGDAEAQR